MTEYFNNTFYEYTITKNKSVDEIISEQEHKNGIHSGSHLSSKYIFEQPIVFDRAVFTERLNPFYGPYIQSAVDYIQNEVSFYDELSGKLITANLDPGLIKKQTVHIFTTANALGEIMPDHIRFAGDYTLAQIVPIQVVDTWIDNSRSPNLSKTMMAEQDIRTAWVTSNVAAYTGAYQMLHANYPRAAGVEAFRVFREVSQAMATCYGRRYEEERLDNPDAEIEFYANSPISRLLGSGFYQVSVHGAMAISGEPITQDVRNLTANMRRVRQFVDEVADWREDLKSGELTFPFLLMLTSPDHAADGKEAIRTVWNRSREITVNTASQEQIIEDLENDRKLNESLDVVKQHLSESNSFDKLYMLGDQLWKHTLYQMDTVFQGKNYFDLMSGLNLKRAFLERLKHQSWEDVPLEVI